MDRVWTKILIAGVLFSVAVLLISFGSSSVIGHNCQLEPSLPIWMITGSPNILNRVLLLLSNKMIILRGIPHYYSYIIIINHTAGTFLLLMVIVTVLLLWWRKTLIQDRKTFMSIGWAFCFGMLLILGFLTWFAIWIAGSYYGVRIVKTIRVNNQYDDNNNGICPMSIIVITFISVISVWIIGIGICISLVVRLFCSTVQDGISSELDEKGKQTVGWKKIDKHISYK